MEMNLYKRVEVHGDGYLWLIDYQHENKGEEHHQPLLLHTVSSLLRQLMETSHHVVLTGRDDDGLNAHENKAALKEKLDANVKDQSAVNQLDANVPKCYQHLKPTDNLAECIVSTLNDLLLYGHNPKLQGRMAKLSRQHKDESSAQSTLLHPRIRLVRTLNSIRALVPILLRILYHPNLKQLPKGRKEKIWLEGTYVFDHTTVALVKLAQSRMQYLLKVFLPSRIAMEVTQKPLEDWSSFWNSQWLPCVSYLSDDDLINLAPSPYDALARHRIAGSNATGAYQEAKVRIMEHCHTCDEKIWPKYIDKSEDIGLQRQYSVAVHQLCQRLNFVLEKDFPGSHFSVYGSCLSNLNLTTSDVDLSLFLPKADQAKQFFQNGCWSLVKYKNEMLTLVRAVYNLLAQRREEFIDTVAVTGARVPLVKGVLLHANNPYTADGSLHFDISFLNDIAVVNSTLLQEYALIDKSVGCLMKAVKLWANEKKICSAQHKYLSSYGWMNMVIFYLQCIDFIPNLQCPKLMQKAGLQRHPSFYWNNVNNLDTFYMTFEQAKQGWKRPEHFDSHPMTHVALLYGFFQFYVSAFKHQSCMISIKRGKDTVLPKTSFHHCKSFFTIEDPFETFDSHCPHNLGMPVMDSQCHKILSSMEASENHLRTLLLQYDNPTDDVKFLWPADASTEPRHLYRKTMNKSTKEVGGCYKWKNSWKKGRQSQKSQTQWNQ